MALKLYERYPQLWESPSNDYPQGAFKNLSSQGETDGSYLEKDWLNDYSGFFGALLKNAQMTPNGTIDTAQRSQFYDALIKVAKNAVADQGYATTSYVDNKFNEVPKTEIINDWDQASDENVFSAQFLKDGLGYVTPEMFGAVGDGVADDTLAIQLALDTGSNVLINEPVEYYRITDTLVIKFAGQVLMGVSRKLGVIRNIDNDKRFIVVGDKNGGPAPRSSIIGLTFRGNNATLGGILIPTSNQLEYMSWRDSSKDVVVSDVVIEGVGSGWALEVYSWCNNITNFTIHSDSVGVAKTRKGIILSDSANQNNLSAIYLTGCLETSLQIGGVLPDRWNLGNRIDGIVVQQSGGDNGCVVVGNAVNTSINSFYSEYNVAKGSPTIIRILNTAYGTDITNVSHLSGGSSVIDNDGYETKVSNIVSSNVSGNVVANRRELEVSGVSWLPQASNPTGLLVGTFAGAKTNWLDRGFGEVWDPEINSQSDNVVASTVLKSNFYVSNGMVTFFGRINIESSDLKMVNVGLSLPVKSNFTSAYDAIGFITSDTTSTSASGVIKGNSSGTRLLNINIKPNSLNNQSYNFSGSYVIK